MRARRGLVHNASAYLAAASFSFSASSAFFLRIPTMRAFMRSRRSVAYALVA